MVGDGDVVAVVVYGAEFVQGVERFSDLSRGRGVGVVRNRWGGGWGVFVAIRELLGPALFECCFRDGGAGSIGEVAEQGGGGDGGGVDEYGLAVGAGEVGQVGAGALAGSVGVPGADGGRVPGFAAGGGVVAGQGGGGSVVGDVVAPGGGGDPSVGSALLSGPAFLAHDVLLYLKVPFLYAAPP